jgi:hypothetical protein
MYTDVRRYVRSGASTGNRRAWKETSASDNSAHAVGQPKSTRTRNDIWVTKRKDEQGKIG